jgi:hypothetical protein
MSMEPGESRDRLIKGVKYRRAKVASNWAELKRAKQSGDIERISKAISEITSLCQSEERLERLIFATGDTVPEVFWPAWLMNWASVDHSAEFHEMLLRLFRSKGSAVPFIGGDERKRYESLPDEIIVYRGCGYKFAKGVSWTTNKEVATFFATGGRYGPPVDPVILTGKVKKHSRNFFWCESRRREAEIVCAPRIIKTEDYVHDPNFKVDNKVEELS